MWGRRARPPEANQAKAALGIKPAEVTRMNEEAIGKALAVVEEPKAAPRLPPRVEKEPVPTDPAGHLSFAKRAVAEMTDREAAIIMFIEDEERRHIERNRELAAQLRDVRMTRAFYATAPSFLSPGKPLPPDAPAADPAPAPKLRPKRSRRPKAAQAEAQQQEAANE